MNKYLKNRINDYSVLKILFSLFFILAFVSTLFFKQLYNDGAYWAFDILNDQNWHREWQFFRLSTLLLQTPAVLLSRIIRNSFFTTWLFCLGYALYPFFTLIFLCKLSKEKMSLLAVFFFSFLICIIPNWSFAVSVTNESICLSWILFFSILIFDKYKILFILSSVALLFSYEVGFIFYPLAAYLLYREKKLNFSSVIFLGLLTILQLINLKYRIIPGNNHVHFKNSFFVSFQNPYFYSGIISIVFFSIASFIKDKKTIKYFWILSIPFFILMLVYAMYVNESYLRHISNSNRVWAIPLSFICMLGSYEILKRQNYKLNFLQIMIISFSGISMLSFEIHELIGQIGLERRISQIIEARSGCYVLTEEEFSLLKGDSFIPTWSLSYYSVLLNKTINPGTVFSTTQFDSHHNEIKNNFCQLKDGALVLNNGWGNSYMHTDRNINFDKIFKK